MGFSDHAVDIDLYLFINHVMEESHHRSLICFPSILQFERNYLVTEGALEGDECGFLHVFRSHFDLVVTGEAIHEGKDHELGNVVYPYVNVR